MKRSHPYAIERRYIGPITGGLLDRWHIPWKAWHVWLSFKTKAERHAKLSEITKDVGWHVRNFEYRKVDA